MLEKLEKVPLHPILFALFPVLTAYTSLIFYVLPEELVFPVILNLSVCALLFALWYGILRHVRRAAIVTSVSVLLIFTFDALAIVVNRTLKSMNIVGNDALYVVPYILIAALITSVFVKSKNEFTLLTKFLNIISLVLVVGNVGYVIMHEAEIQSKLKAVRDWQINNLSSIKLVAQKDNPDIYYIILDAFGRTEVLNEVYNYDNSAFVKQLEKRGFTVAKNSRSNYQVTILSLPSALNIEYLSPVEKIMGRDSIDNVVLYRLIQRNNVTQALKKIGYRFESMRSGYAPTDYIPEADDNIGSPFGNIFHLAFARGTIIGPFQRYLDFMGNAARETRTYALNHPEEFISKPSPKFSLIHILIPHPPFLFNEDGSPIVIDQISLAEAYTKEKYVGQVKFIQNRILTFIDALQKDGRKKVIIIQGDHGPAIQEKPDAPPSDAFLNERFRILNAYYLPKSNPNEGGEEARSDIAASSPDTKKTTNSSDWEQTSVASTGETSSRARGHGSTVYDTITPVNSFRVVLNKYFDAKLPLLEDKLYFSPTATPFAFEDVTKRVKP